jgi:arylsulfatase A-like enzyme
MKKEFPDFPIERYHRRLYSLRRGDWKIISCPRGGQELYNLRNDPRELVDLSRARPLIRARMLEELRRHYPEALPRESVQTRLAGESKY